MDGGVHNTLVKTHICDKWVCRTETNGLMWSPNSFLYAISGVPKKVEQRIFSTLQAKSVIFVYTIR